MSLVPFSGRRPTSTHPDALRTAQSLGRLARQLYDWYNKPGSGMPKAIMGSSSSGGGRSRGSNSSLPTNASDLRVRPPSTRRPQSVPRNLSSLITWDTVKIDSTITLSTGGVVETNYTFSLLDNPQQANWAALFDQWCIVEASATWRSQLPPGSSAPPVILVTALDFDSVGSVGSIAALEDFGTSAVCLMGHGAVVTRSVRPCVKFSTQQAGSNVNSGMSTPWIDSGATGTLHFGLRSVAGIAAAAYTIDVTRTIVFAFRNTI